MFELKFLITAVIICTFVYIWHRIDKARARAVKEMREHRPFRAATLHVRKKYDIIVYTKKVFPNFDCSVIHPAGWEYDHTGKIQWDSFIKMFRVVPVNNQSISGQDLVYLVKITDYLNTALEEERTA